MNIRSILGLLVIWLMLTATAKAADEYLSLEEMAAAAQQFAEGLDPEVLSELASGDPATVTNTLNRLLASLQKNYLLDVAELKPTAESLVPMLEQWEETYPYAIWLKTRLDYMEVAESLSRTSPRGTNAPAPATRATREVWVQKLAQRPWPPKAAEHVKALKPVFTAQKVPPELVWIAEVESSFDPRAKSPAGAAGLFQLMPATAKRFGLRTFPLDQRYRPEPSAQAAAQYLRFLYSKFGDWRLALAAYNAGEGTVQRARGNNTKGSFDAIASRLPAETQLYVPKVEATLLRREGLRLQDLKIPQG